MKQLGAAESCCYGNHCRCVVQGIINPRFLEFVKRKNEEERERKQTEINITNQKHCKHFWKEDTIALLNVTCQAEHCRGQRNLAVKNILVSAKKKEEENRTKQTNKQTKKRQTLEGTETVTKSITGHWVHKKQQMEKSTSWKSWIS